MECMEKKNYPDSQVFACPTLLLPFCDALVCFLGNGLIESMLQPYAVKNGATVGQVGVIFLALGGTYMVMSPVSGWVRTLKPY